MKTTLTTIVLSRPFPIGCVDDFSFLSSPETQIIQQSNSPYWVKLTEKEGMSAENQFSVTAYIDTELFKEAK